MKPITLLRRALPLASLGLLALPLLAGCETMMPSNGRLEQDVLEIKTRLNESIARQESSERALDSQLTALSESSEKNNNLHTSTLEELQKRMIEQQEELNKLRGVVEEISFNLKNRQAPPPPASTFGTDPGMNTPPGDPGIPSGTTPAPATPTTPVAAPAQQLFTEATNLFNSGQYAQAREAFTQALGTNPTGDLKVDILFGLAESAFALKEFDGAEKSYNDVIRADQKNPKAWNSLERLADIDTSKGNKARAIQRLEYIEKYPRYSNMESVKQKLAQLRAQ